MSPKLDLRVARHMVGADILKLRRHRPTMLTATVLSLGITLLYLFVILSRHGGHLPGEQTLLNGTELMGLYFGSFAAILIGAEAGTIDQTNGVDRDLAATGRTGSTLFLSRIPAAVFVALLFTLSGLFTTIAASYAFHGTAPAPRLVSVVESVGWVTLASTVLTTLAVCVSSITGSKGITLTAIIGWQTVATGIVYAATFLGSARDLALSIALCRLLPGPAIGTRAHPGSSIALLNYKLPMPASIAVLVIAAWVLIPIVAARAHANRQR